MNLSPLPIQKFFDNAGKPLNGGLLFTYIAGTTTKLATYQDQAGVPNSNPVVLNFRGEASVWLDQSLTYKFVLSPEGDTDPPTRPIWSVDNISAGITFASLTQQIIGQILYPRTAMEISMSVTPVSYWYPPGNAFRYMTTAQIQDVSSGTGALDVTAPLQNCLKAAHQSNAFFPSGRYSIAASLPVYNQNILGAAKEYVTIVPTGNFETFTNSGVEFITGSIRQLNILYNNGVQPTTSLGNDRKIGFYWTTVIGRSPNLFDISDVQVKGAWWFYYDDSGSYGCSFSRTLAWNCQNGYLKTNGTTFRFEEAICLNVNSQFTITNHQGLSLACCAGDGATLTAGTSAVILNNCAGFVIDGWDSESNAINGNDASLFLFQDSQGLFNGWTGHANAMSCTTGENCQVVKCVNSQVTITGMRTTYLAGDLTFSGLGSVFTILAASGSLVTAIGSDVSAATGGTPANRNVFFASGTAKIQYINCTFSSGSVGALSFEISTFSGTFTGTLTGVTGSVTGTLRYRLTCSGVILYLPDLTGTSNTTACTVTGAPAAIFPARTQTLGGARIQDNSVRAFGLAQVGTGGTITLFPSAAAGAWTAANTKGIESCTLTYSLD